MSHYVKTMRVIDKEMKLKILNYITLKTKVLIEMS